MPTRPLAPTASGWIVEDRMADTVRPARTRLRAGPASTTHEHPTYGPPRTAFEPVAKSGVAEGSAVVARR